MFLNGERARTWHSAANKVPGLHASVTDVTKGNMIPQYLSATGIQSIASQPIISNTTITPYAAFPVILANLTVGKPLFRFFGLILLGLKTPRTC